MFKFKNTTHLLLISLQIIYIHTYTYIMIIFKDLYGDVCCGIRRSFKIQS